MMGVRDRLQRFDTAYELQIAVGMSLDPRRDAPAAWRRGSA